MAGDFNETRFPSERSSSSRETTRRSHQFNEWIDDLHLLELEFSGASHTWSRGLSQETRQSGRLDRALCNDAWGLMFDQAHVRHLPAVQSDHSPLFISPNGFVPIQEVNRPFRFQATWLTHEQFQDFVNEKWRLDCKLLPALEFLAHDLKTWNREVFRNIFKQKRVLLARSAGIQKVLSERHERGLIKLESKLRIELDEMLEREETLWYQKSRIDWLQDGDRNTTFFHLSTVARRWKNNILAIKDDEGNWLYDKQRVKDQIVLYFERLFSEEGDNDPFAVPQDIFPELSRRDWDSLSRAYSTVEIDMVVKEMGSLKAPGPDGFQALFYQKNWALVAPKMYSLALDVLEGRGIPDHLNDTYIALIPKIVHLEFASQFRPIGLCNVAYKIITKVIVNRLKPILPGLISNTQASFVPGRQITDNSDNAGSLTYHATEAGRERIHGD